MILRFLHPWLLLTGLLIPLWIWARHSRKFKTSLNFPALNLLKQLPVSKVQRWHPLLNVLGALGIGLLIIALARPQSGLRQRTVTADTVDIVLAIDSSTSMRAVDLGENNDENRLDAVKKVAESFVDARPADRFSLIAFAAMPYTKAPLTLDHGWLRNRLAELKTGELPDGTAVGSALVSAVNRLKDSEASSKIIVLLTDGISNAGDIEPLNAAPLAADLGIRVYTIGAGSDGPVRYPTTDVFGRSYYDTVQIPIDTQTLQKIADITGGRFFRARDGKELEAVFDEIDNLERTEIELNEYTLYTEQFFWFALAGCSLLMLERLLAAGRLGRTLA